MVPYLRHPVEVFPIKHTNKQTNQELAGPKKMSPSGIRLNEESMSPNRPKTFYIRGLIQPLLMAPVVQRETFFFRINKDPGKTNFIANSKVRLHPANIFHPSSEIGASVCYYHKHWDRREPFVHKLNQVGGRVIGKLFPSLCGLPSWIQ